MYIVTMNHLQTLAMYIHADISKMTKGIYKLNRVRETVNVYLKVSNLTFGIPGLPCLLGSLESDYHSSWFY